MAAARFTITTALALSLSGLAATSMAQSETPKLVTTIPPLAAIASDVFDGVGETSLLIRNGGSPHAYSLRPSDAATLADADYVLWVGEGLETFLAGKLDTLAPTAVQIEAMELPGLTLLEYRPEAHGHHDDHHGDHDDHGHDDHGHDDHKDHDDHEKHAHDDHGHNDHGHDDHGHDDHGHDDHKDHHDHEEHAGHDHHGHNHAAGDDDVHIWTDPENALAIAVGLAGAVRPDLDADQQVKLDANLAAVRAAYTALDEEVAAKLAPVSDKPFLTFHDAYQYMEVAYDMNYQGAVTVSPEVKPGAASLRALRQEVANDGIVCIFAEPQFEPRAINTIAEGLEVKKGILDPLGDAEFATKGGYEKFIRQLVAGYTDCLG
ncbi:MAG: zinc ABC transporter substrate-binding protein [Alphaproteobacteria bacterium]|nr:zinc ABC transporter substrate-binding protein [Alphaproteobacteria bacterium SS10]